MRGPHLCISSLVHCAHDESPVGNAKVVALLLEDRRGAVTDMQDINGDTALHFAASHNHLKVLASSLTPRTQSFRHQLTHTSGRPMSLQIVKMLLKKGAAASLLNEKKLSPLDVATPSVQSYLKGLFLCSRARYDIWLIHACNTWQ
jgi:ankyrin repeat protein